MLSIFPQKLHLLNKIAIFLNQFPFNSVMKVGSAEQLPETPRFVAYFIAKASLAFLLPMPSREELAHAELMTLDSQGPLLRSRLPQKSKFFWQMFCDRNLSG